MEALLVTVLLLLLSSTLAAAREPSSFFLTFSSAILDCHNCLRAFLFILLPNRHSYSCSLCFCARFFFYLLCFKARFWNVKRVSINLSCSDPCK
jgi:hypothetical protein